MAGRTGEAAGLLIDAAGQARDGRPARCGQPVFIADEAAAAHAAFAGSEPGDLLVFCVANGPGPWRCWPRPVRLPDVPRPPGRTDRPGSGGLGDRVVSGHDEGRLAGIPRGRRDRRLDRAPCGRDDRLPRRDARRGSPAGRRNRARSGCRGVGRRHHARAFDADRADQPGHVGARGSPRRGRPGDLGRRARAWCDRRSVGRPGGAVRDRGEARRGRPWLLARHPGL